jgi:hypothetical protein
MSKLKLVMWGSATIGFGARHHVYKPRKQAIALYLAGGLEPLQDELSNLGKHTAGKGCPYIKSLNDVDTIVLRRILTKSYASVK